MNLAKLLIVSVVSTLIIQSTLFSAPPPDWTKDLVIYEINPRGYTSPNGVGDGNGSGTFKSLEEKMAYLQEIGITGIWLAGFSKANSHFYGIWAVYGCEHPDSLDPVLGTPADFKSMIDEAHSRGIKVFLDVVAHGVVNESSLITQHPAWFSGGTWNMTDYNYSNQEFRSWWMDVWTNYVVKYGVDGFREDVGLFDRVIWDSVTARCQKLGHPIVVFGELTRYHFSQWDNKDYVSHNVPEDYPGTRPEDYYSVQVSSHDAGWEAGPGNYYKNRGSRFKMGYSALFTPNIPIFFGGEEWDADQISLPALKQGLYGTGGKGGWMYGSQLIWSQQNDANKLSMLNDFKKMMAIKKANSDILSSGNKVSSLLAVSRTPATGPVPYARYQSGEKAIIIVGNSSMKSDVTYTLSIPLDAMGLGGLSSYRVTDLWTGTVTSATATQLSRYPVTIGPDNGPNGLIDDKDPGFTYSSGWEPHDIVGHYENTSTLVNRAGAWFSYTFTGTSITWITQKFTDAGAADIFIDGVKDAFISNYDPNASARVFRYPAYTKTGLSSGKHTIKIVTVNDGWVTNDALVIPGTATTTAISGGIRILKIEDASTTAVSAPALIARAAPVLQGLQLRLPGSGVYAIDIFTPRGARAESFQVKAPGAFDLSKAGLSNGVYQIRVRTGADIFWLKAPLVH